MKLSTFSYENGGQFPASELGWADALLELNTTGDPDFWIPAFTGVDDDGSIFRSAIKTGVNIDESKCSRVYVQGLSSKSKNFIAILFDHYSEPGGDHFRSPLGDPLREVLLVGGSHEMIKDEDWPEFVQSQRELLAEEGFSEEDIREIYGNE